MAQSRQVGRVNFDDNVPTTVYMISAAVTKNVKYDEFFGDISRHYSRLQKVLICNLKKIDKSKQSILFEFLSRSRNVN